MKAPKSCKHAGLKKEVKKHLKEDIKESKESISEDKSLISKMKQKALSGMKRSQRMAPKSAKKAK